MTDLEFAVNVALTRHFQETGLIRDDLIAPLPEIVREAHLTVSEPVDTSRLFISARSAELCRAVYRATGKAREGTEQEYLNAYAQANHIRPASPPQWVKR